MGVGPADRPGAIAGQVPAGEERRAADQDVAGPGKHEAAADQDLAAVGGDDSWLLAAALSCRQLRA